MNKLQMTLNRNWTWSLLWSLAIVTASLSFTTPAEARRIRREGFNFGLNVRVLDTNDKTYSNSEHDRKSHTKATGQGLSPYVAYSFGAINLGLLVSVDHKESETKDQYDNGTTVDRAETISTKGTSLFMRFLFGDYFFFEGGAGVYQQSLTYKEEIKNSSGDNYFNGKENSQSHDGMGPGYHVGGGIELPMGGDFVFTSSYQLRVMQLRDAKDGFDLGSKRAWSQKRELLFGIAHYYR